MAMTVCKILEGILPKESVRGAPPPDKKLLEYNFVFACVWAFGACMLVDKVYDYKCVLPGRLLNSIVSCHALIAPDR